MKIIKSEDKLVLKLEDGKVLELIGSVEQTNNETDAIDKTIEYLTNPEKNLPSEVSINYEEMTIEEKSTANNIKKFIDEFLAYREKQLK